MKIDVNFQIELRKNPYKGLYIAIEGTDGCGKSTQITNLTKKLKEKGHTVVLTGEPNNSLIVGKLIRDVLFSRVKIPPKAYQLLYSADRALNHATIVESALKKGKIVISHRSFWSNIPHGVEDLGERSHVDAAANQIAVATGMLSYYHQFIKADLSFYLDVSVDTVVKRLLAMEKKKDIYENRDKLKKIIANYHYLLQKFPKEIIVINGERDPFQITEEIFGYIQKHKKFS